MSDALLDRRRFRTFNVVDDFNREALHIEIDTSITSLRLVRIFEQLRTEHGLPQVLRTDNGPEFLGEAFTTASSEMFEVSFAWQSPPIQSIPEPSSIALFGIGALGLFGYGRRRRQTSAAA